MYYKFATLDANVDDIIYVRKEKSVVAAKIVKFAYGNVYVGCNPDSSYVYLIYAGNGNVLQKEYVSMRDSKDKYFRTIEDCIYEKNAIQVFYTSGEEIASNCGLDATLGCTSYGMSYYGVWKYLWDGFRPEKKHVSLFRFHFVNDADGWHYVVNKESGEKEPKRYYDSYEDCLADNEVKVITF